MISHSPSRESQSTSELVPKFESNREQHELLRRKNIVVHLIVAPQWNLPNLMPDKLKRAIYTVFVQCHKYIPFKSFYLTQKLLMPNYNE